MGRFFDVFTRPIYISLNIAISQILMFLGNAHLRKYLSISFLIGCSYWFCVTSNISVWLMAAIASFCARR